MSWAIVNRFLGQPHIRQGHIHPEYQADPIREYPADRREESPADQILALLAFQAEGHNPALLSAVAVRCPARRAFREAVHNRQSPAEAHIREYLVWCLARLVCPAEDRNLVYRCPSYLVDHIPECPESLSHRVLPVGDHSQEPREQNRVCRPAVRSPPHLVLARRLAHRRRRRLGVVA